jgi:signal transduction histidine kinase
MMDALEQFSEGEATQADVEARLSGYADQTGARLTLIDAMGHAWLDSSGVLPSGSQANTPEVAAALHGQMLTDSRSDENGTPSLFVAVPLRHERISLGVVRLAVSIQAAHSLILERWLALGVGILLLTIFSMIASLLLAASLTRPLDQLRRSALRLAGGDLAHRAPQDHRTDEIGQLASAFNHMADQVQAMLEEQRAFASNASHELRTPLTTIRLRSEALRLGTLDEQTSRRYIAEIDEETARLGGLVEDLILLSRLDAGHTEPGSEEVDPRRLARDLLREMTPIAEEHGVTLTLDAPGELSLVQAGANHLRVVFRNLLDNAIKYTSRGGTVTWKLWVDGVSLCSEVIDTGQGITPDDLPHLFKRFYRADKAHARVTPGAGLGLSLVESVVGFYGGQVKITSPGLGQGTSVHVRWPLAAQTHRQNYTAHGHT